MAAAGTVFGIVSAVCGMAARWVTGFADPTYLQLVTYLIVGLIFAASFALKGIVGRLLFLLPCLLATILLIALVAAWLKNGFHLGTSASDVSPLKQRELLYLTSAETLLAILSLLLLHVAGLGLFGRVRKR